MQFAALGKAWKCSLQDYSVVEDTPSSDKPASSVGVLRLDRLRRSRRTGEETQVRFVNRTEAEVQLSWVDAAGKPGVMPRFPGERHEQHTFAGHVWIVTDNADAALAIFQATAEPGEAVVDGSQRPEVSDANEAERPRAGPAEAASPDGQWLASIRDYNVLLKSTSSDEQFALTRDGSEQDAYQPAFHWSPDGRKLVVHATDSRPEPRDLSDRIVSRRSVAAQAAHRALRQARRSHARRQAATV